VVTAYDDEPGDDDLDEEAGSEMVECSSCGRPVYEDAEKCPHCGDWITAGGEAARRAQGWFWPVVVALLIAVVLVVWHGLGR